MTKRRSQPKTKPARSPYAKKNKRPYDYSAMYAREPHLRAARQRALEMKLY